MILQGFIVLTYLITKTNYNIHHISNGKRELIANIECEQNHVYFRETQSYLKNLNKSFHLYVRNT